MTSPRPLASFLSSAEADELVQLLDDVAGRDLTEDELTRVTHLENKAHRARVAEQRKIVTKPLHVSGGHQADDAELTAAFTAYLRTGQPNADLSQLRAAQGEGTPSSGGYLVPSGFRRKLVDRLKAYGGVAAWAEEVTTETGNTLPWPVLDDTANLGEVVSEHGTFSAGADLEFDTASLGAYRYAAGGSGSTPVRISVELLQDAEIDVAALVARKLAERIGRIQAPHLVTGSGVSQPKGIIHGRTGVQTAANNALTYDDLLTFIHSVDPAYREAGNCGWMFNDTSLLTIRKLKDTAGDPLWRPSTADMGTMVGGGSLLGFPVKIDQAFPNFTNNSPAINWGVFGDVAEGYVVRRVRDVVIAINPYSRMSYGEVEFSAWARMDAVPQNPNAYSALTGKA
ncbi:MAG: phage major capsid protein [Pseudonocardia sp.]|nr:phage major capsid protein [Pseudonocardia sp.]